MIAVGWGVGGVWLGGGGRKWHCACDKLGQGQRFATEEADGGLWGKRGLRIRVEGSNVQVQNVKGEAGEVKGQTCVTFKAYSARGECNRAGGEEILISLPPIKQQANPPK